MKKILLVLGAMAAFSLGATAENVGDTIVTTALKYRVTTATTVEVLGGVDSKTKSYTIPSTVTGTDGKTYTVTAIGEYAFRWSSATNVVLPSTITEIKDNAFASSSIVTINLPEGLKKIGKNAFSSCSGIKSIDIPASVDSIGSSAFFGSSWKEDATSLTLHEGLKYIGESAFYSQDFTEVDIPSSVEEIAGKAFLYNKKLTKVTIKEGVKKFGDAVFNGCILLSDIMLPNSLDSVGIELFLNDKALKKINIPAGLRYIGESFIAGTSVADIELSPDNTAFVKKDGVVYTSDYSVLKIAPVVGITELTVDSRCLGIDGGAFWSSSIQSIKLPETLVAIGYGAFEASQLSSINWPKNLVWIDTEAFANTQFTEVTLPDNVNYINDGVFSGCKKLTKLTIPSGVKQIYNHAFTNCSALKTVVAEGAEAPTLMEAYDSYEEAFYGIASGATITVPKGSKDSYSKQGYDSYFTISESLAGTLKAVSVTPADSSKLLAQFQPMSFNITFDSPVTIDNDSPAVRIQKGDGGSNTALFSFSASLVEPDGTWHVVDNSSDHKTITVWADDGYGDGDTQTFSTEDTTYYVIIPSKIVRASSGLDVSEQITLFYYGGKKATGINGIFSDNKTADSRVIERYNLSGQKVSAAQKGIQILRYTDGTTRKVLMR